MHLKVLFFQIYFRKLHFSYVIVTYLLCVIEFFFPFLVATIVLFTTYMSEISSKAGKSKLDDMNDIKKRTLADPVTSL